MLNVVHHVRRTDCDLHVPVVLWAYRTMTMQALLKLKYEAGAIIPMDHVKPSLRIVARIDTMVGEA